MKKKTPLIIILCVIGVALLGGGIFAAIKLAGSRQEFRVEDRDVQKYFEERAEIISVTPVKKSKYTLTEKDVMDEFEARGFTQYPVTTSYSYDGKYADPVKISSSSSDKHPIYETYYVTSKNEIWVITALDGMILATPSTYNVSNTGKVPVLISESEEIASYDSTTNSIYLTKPKAEAVDVRVVKRIDAQAIESMRLEAKADDPE